MTATSEDVPYCRWKPTEKQRLFLKSNTKEVFFGGAAGGGKSVALLMGALKYAKVSGYAALIIRKDLRRLELAGGLIPRSHELFQDTDARWNAAKRMWTFPTGEHHRPATLTFGYLANPNDKYRYASSEFQYIAFDELTDFEEEDYLFLFSRLRRQKGMEPKLRMRSASNPGGLGRAWVRQRFVEGAVGEHAKAVEFMKEGRCYIPARIADNKYLDEEEYRTTLLHLPPVERERLMNGDWSVQEAGMLKAEWLRYFLETKEQLELLGAGGELVAVIPEGSCRRFITIDPAGTSADRTREARGKGASWTVAQVWDQGRREKQKFLMLRHQVRARLGFDELCGMVERLHAEWKPERIWIEEEKLGRAVCDLLDGDLPIACISTGCKDKATRAGKLIMKLERGEVFLPRYENAWRPGFEGEVLAWTGDERQLADQIDAAAYAAIVAEDGSCRPIKISGKAGKVVCV